MEATALMIIRVIAVVAAGLVAGAYLVYRTSVYYGLQELGASGFVQVQQAMHVRLLKFVPALVLGDTVAIVVWLFMIRSQWTSAQFWLVAAATCGNLLAFVLTIAVNVPINNKLMTWNVASPPANLKELWAPWDRIHTVRTIITVGVLILEAAALSVRASASSL
jgi:uncharacterized membrane protein